MISDNVLNTRIDITDIGFVISKMQEWIRNKAFGNYICISNMNDIVHSDKDINVSKATNAAALSVPDGMSLVFLARLKGFNIKKRIYGPDLMRDFLVVSNKRGYRNFFYGSTESTLKSLVCSLKEKFPSLTVAGTYSPPFGLLSKEEEGSIVNMINNSEVDVLWVGLGCPKQQLWMYRYKDRLRVPVMVGVGAAFDFLSGQKPQAPIWMQNSGLEWFFRLLKEPKRLWKRYLLGNLAFLYLAIKSLMSRNQKLEKES